MSESEITKVQLVIRKFLFETREVVKDPQASMEWLSKFRDTLMYQDCEKEPCGYALTLLMEARKFNESQREKIQTRHARKALLDEGIENPSREQIDRKRAEMYSEEETTEGAANGNNADVSATAPTVDAPATREDWKSLVSASLSMAGTSNNEAAVTTKNQRQRRAGGSVRESVDPLPPARQRVKLPSSKQEVIDFALDNHLDTDDAGDWWERHMRELGGKTHEGKRIDNWRGMVIGWCENRRKKREIA